MGIMTCTASAKRNGVTGQMAAVGFLVFIWPPVASPLRGSAKEGGKLLSLLGLSRARSSMGNDCRRLHATVKHDISHACFHRRRSRTQAWYTAKLCMATGAVSTEWTLLQSFCAQSFVLVIYCMLLHLQRHIARVQRIKACQDVTQLNNRVITRCTGRPCPVIRIQLLQLCFSDAGMRGKMMVRGGSQSGRWKRREMKTRI